MRFFEITNQLKCSSYPFAVWIRTRQLLIGISIQILIFSTVDTIACISSLALSDIQNRKVLKDWCHPEILRAVQELSLYTQLLGLEPRGIPRTIPMQGEDQWWGLVVGDACGTQMRDSHEHDCRKCIFRAFIHTCDLRKMWAYDNRRRNFTK